MRAALILLAVAACDDGIVIEVVIPPDSPATQVELFLGFGKPCKTDVNMDGTDELCPGIGPPTDTPFAGRQVLPGQVFHVDDTKPFVADVDGGSAWFQVESADVELPVVIAVGTGPDGPESVAIAKQLSIADSPQHLRIHLEPAGTGLIKPVPVGNNVQIWPDPSPDRDPGIETCVGAEFAGERIFVVPESNPDCDNVAATDECKRFVFEAEEVARQVVLGESTCTFDDTGLTGDGTPICRLGGQVCDESEGGVIGCANTDVVCVSNHMCASCKRLDANCVGDAFNLGTSPSPPVSHVKCNVEIQVDPNQGTSKPCVTRSTSAVFGGSCNPPQLSRIGYPFSNFVSQLSIPTGNNLFVQLSAATPVVCGFILDHSGEFPFDGNGLPPADLGLWTTFKTATHTVMLPVVVHWIPVPLNQCSAADASSKCDYVPIPSDNVDHCFDS